MARLSSAADRELLKTCKNGTTVQASAVSSMYLCHLVPSTGCFHQLRALIKMKNISTHMEGSINRNEEGVSSRFVKVRKHFLLLQLTREVSETKKKESKWKKFFALAFVWQKHWTSLQHWCNWSSKHFQYYACQLLLSQTAFKVLQPGAPLVNL